MCRQSSPHPAHQPVHHQRVQLIRFDEAERREFTCIDRDKELLERLAQ
jgi:hypothetical protein